MPVSGDTLRYSNASTFSLPIPRTTGAGQTWNYGTRLRSQSQEVSQYKSALSANLVYGIFFGLNAYGLKLYDTMGSGALTFTNGYDFYRRSAQSFNAVGKGVSYSGIPIPSTYTDQDEVYQFPLNYGDKDTSTYRVKFDVPTLGSYTQAGRRYNSVMGSGTLTTPYGTFQTLLVRAEVRYTDTLRLSILPFPIPLSGSTIHYVWLANNQHGPLLDMTVGKLGSFEYVTAVRYRDGVNQFAEPLPEPDFFTLTRRINIGDSAAFINLTPSFTGVNFDWKAYQGTDTTATSAVRFADGTTATSRNSTMKFSQPGFYSVRLRATNTAGSADTTKVAYVEVRGTPPPKPDFISFDRQLEVGDSTNFLNLTFAFSGVSWRWRASVAGDTSASPDVRFANGTTATDRNTSMKFSAPGFYSIYLQATTNGGSDDTMKVGYIEVRTPTPPPLPKPDFIAVRRVMDVGQSTPFVNLTPSFSGVSFRWRASVGTDTTTSADAVYISSTTNQSRNPVIRFNRAGFYTIRLAATNANGTADTTKMDYIEVRDTLVPKAVPDFIALQTQLRMGDSTDFVNQTVPLQGIAFAWKVMSGTDTTASPNAFYAAATSDTSRNPTIRFTAPGLYSIRLSATNGGGTADTVKVNYIEVLAPPPPRPVVDFSADTLQLYVGDSTGFTNLTSPMENLAFLWKISQGSDSLASPDAVFAGGTSDTSRHPMVKFLAVGVYSVSLAATDAVGNVDTTKVNYIEVLNAPPPPPAFVDFQAGSVLLNEGDSALITNLTSPLSSQSYKWQVMLGSDTLASPNAVFVSGTSDTSRHPVVKFLIEGLYSVHLTATGPGGTADTIKLNYIDVRSFTDARNAQSLTALSVWPNPAHGTLMLKTQARQAVVYNSAGMFVLSADLPKVDTHPLDISALPKGLYLIKAGNASARFVVE